MKLCIIGAGVSGLLLILLLAETEFPLNQICIIDPYFDGGDLVRKWSAVMSNTPWSATLTNIKTFLPSVKIPKWAEAIPLDSPTPVITIAKLIRECAKPLLEKVSRVHGLAESANWSSANSLWTISVKKEQSKEIITSTAIILTYGADPKELDIPVPSIPLEVALNKDRLSTYIEPHHKVVVFGTRHSGIYVLKNLVDCSVNSIVGIHKEKEPFLFARDNNYDGIKLGGATIADAILKGSYPSIRLVQTSNLSTILREVRSADWVVYAIGFQPRHTLKITKDSIEQSLAYDLSGSIINCPSTWGFGIAYPSQAPDGIHWDIGVSSFLEHIHRQISSINRVE